MTCAADHPVDDRGEVAGRGSESRDLETDDGENHSDEATHATVGVQLGTHRTIGTSERQDHHRRDRADSCRHGDHGRTPPSSRIRPHRETDGERNDRAHRAAMD